jgi:mannose-6-phosphate isomerase-like protein (cupin superfamily)
MTVTRISEPVRIEAAGTPTKIISEFIGRVASSDESVSIAIMDSPSGWKEPGQTPAFDEFTVVLEGEFVVESRGEATTVAAGQAVHVPAGEWVRYSTPGADGARYVSVCMPAFSPETVHRDEETSR